MNCYKCGKRMKAMPDSRLKCTFLTCVACGNKGTYEWATSRAPVQPPARPQEPKPATSQKRAQEPKNQDVPAETTNKIPDTRLQVLLLAMAGFSPYDTPVFLGYIEQNLAKFMQATQAELTYTVQFAVNAGMMSGPNAGVLRRIGPVPMLFSAETIQQAPTPPKKDDTKRTEAATLQEIIDSIAWVAKRKVVFRRSHALDQLVRICGVARSTAARAINLAVKAKMLERPAGETRYDELVRLENPIDVEAYLMKGMIIRRKRLLSPQRWYTPGREP